MTLWTILSLPPDVGSYAGPFRVRRKKGRKVELYRNLDTGQTVMLIERPAIGPPVWAATEDPSA